MRAVWAEGVLFVPVRVEQDGVIGDTMIPVGPDYPGYAEWLASAQVLAEGASLAEYGTKASEKQKEA